MKKIAQKVFEVLVGYSFVNIVLPSLLAMILAIIGLPKGAESFQSLSESRQCLNMMLLAILLQRVFDLRLSKEEKPFWGITIGVIIFVAYIVIQILNSKM